MKIIKFIGFIIITTIFIACFFMAINQDCEENPPQTLVCSSNNLIDNNLDDCILLEYANIGVLGFGSHDKIYSCERNGQRIEMEYKETKCNYAISNLSSDYKFCRGFN